LLLTGRGLKRISEALCAGKNKLRTIVTSVLGKYLVSTFCPSMALSAAMNKQPENAISPSRRENYPEWYQSVIKAAELAENSPVRGCMVIRPWGYGIWEKMQYQLDQMIKNTGHENAYFPLFIPLSFLEKEAAHVEGFAKECAVVTHHRLEVRDGKLIPTGELEEPLVVRPTSETIIGESFANWVQSYRDLPILINQWANVVRWEMRPRLFLRTSEFLWQEGHTVHATKQEAMEETLKMAEVYRSFVEDVMGIPVIAGEKPAFERFPGAEQSFCIEAMMQDGKALQAGTSHFLGQNFAKASNIKFLDRSGSLQTPFTTSWGSSTRLIGALIMTHSDDDGLRLPPKIAPKQVVIVPVIPKPEVQSSVIEYAEKIAALSRKLSFNGFPISVSVDTRDIRGGEKNWHWIKKGVPIRLEAGPKDVEQGKVVLYRRDKSPKEKQFLSLNELESSLPAILTEIQDNLFEQAKLYRKQRMHTDISSLEDLKKFFEGDDAASYATNGFVVAKWCGDKETEALLEGTKITVRCIPNQQQSEKEGPCIISKHPTRQEAVFAKAY
jgi:prolyl-tRNA synthetase